jgi:enoyl-CoA hydratase
MSESLIVEHRGSLAEITLNRPNQLNRFDEELHIEFTKALEDLRSRGELRAIVLASTGEVFSAGGDAELIKLAQRDLQARLKVTETGRRLLATLIDMRQPVVVAMQGDAIGLGASIALACDAIVAARTACLADPHVLVGLVAGDGGCLVWPQAAGMLRAKRYLLTGERLSAADAHTMGLVTDLVDTPDECLPAARSLAERIASLPPLAVQLTKMSLNRVMQQRFGEVVDLSLALETLTLGTEDLGEALAARREGRPGHYGGL